MGQKKTRFSRRKVLELKSKMSGLKQRNQQLFAIFDDADELDKGNSIREIAATLLPNHVNSTNGEPTLYGQLYAKKLIQKWRQSIIKANEKGGAGQAVVVPFAENGKDGWLYYNMQTKEEFGKIEDLGEKVIAGIERLLTEFLKILNIRQSEKDDINNEMRQEIRKTLLTLRKSRRSKNKN